MYRSGELVLVGKCYACNRPKAVLHYSQKLGGIICGKCLDKPLR